MSKSKAHPVVRTFMTSFPHTIGIEQSLAKAEKMMTDLRVRHLPVLSGGQLVGVLSDRDIRLVESFRDVNPETTPISEAFTPEPYAIAPDAPLADVCKEMADHRYSSALICENGKLVGIFTWIDALRAIRRILES